MTNQTESAVQTHYAIQVCPIIRGARWPALWAHLLLAQCVLRHPVVVARAMRAVRRSAAPTRYYVSVAVNGRDLWTWKVR